MHLLFRGESMPYRHAHWCIAALFIGTLIAFWPGYIAEIGKAPLALHIHGLTASSWMLLLAARSWTIHHGGRTVHRQLGLATFVVAPLFALGNLGVIQSMAIETAAGDPFYALWGVPLSGYDGAAALGFIVLVGLGMRHRRSVHLHAAYMLGTILMLVGPVSSRLINAFIPGFIVDGPQHFDLFARGIHAGTLISLAIVVGLYLTNRRAARPLAVTAAFIAGQSILFETLPRMAGADAAFATFGAMPHIVVGVSGAAVCVAVLWLGWTAGSGLNRSIAPA